ncbi:hypothetical protein HYV74_01040 [Candidatus Uhrbacteria bacterium]|nr:hypothetical protein [Candidatus Uhrbacteria bacterium]
MEFRARPTMIGQWVRYGARGIFALLLVFEGIGLLGAFRYPIAFTWIGLFTTLVVVWGFLELSEFFLLATYGYRYPAIVWPIAVVGVMVDALGDILRLYVQWSWYDQVAHLIGSTLATLVLGLWSDRAQWYGRASPHAPRMLSVVTLGITAGVLYELEEYAEDVLFHTNRLGDGPDTANDLLMNVMGAVLAVAVLRYQWHRRARAVPAIEAPPSATAVRPVVSQG